MILNSFVNGRENGFMEWILHEKRERARALQDLADAPSAWTSRSVLECGSPLPLYVNKAIQAKANGMAVAFTVLSACLLRLIPW